MLPLGAYRHRIRFERRGDAVDDYGNVQNNTWSTVTSVRASFRPQFGRESVEAGRLESTMTGTVTVLRSSVTDGILPSDRIVFRDAPWGGKVCNIRSIVPTIDEIEFVVDEGVAT